MNNLTSFCALTLALKKCDEFYDKLFSLVKLSACKHVDRLLKFGLCLRASKHILASFLRLCSQQDVLVLRKLRPMSST